MKKLILLIFGVLVITSCSKVPLSLELGAKDLSFEKGLLLYKGDFFTGKLYSFYPKTKQLKTEKYYKDGKLHGIEKQWYLSGKIASERYYTNGYKTGKHVGYWPNEQIKFEYYFNALGQHHGEANEWFSNGVPMRYFHYENGKEEGSQKMFKPNGTLRSNYVVVNGERFGLIGLKKCDAVSTL